MPSSLSLSLPCLVSDTSLQGSFLWLLVSWCPDSAATRDKMLFAATKATFKQELGGGRLAGEYYANRCNIC